MIDDPDVSAILAAYCRTAAPILILDIGLDGRVSGCNAAAASFLGGDPVGRPAADFFVEAGSGEEDFQALAAAAGPYRRHIGPPGGEPRTFDFRFYDRGGSVMAVGAADVEEIEMLQGQLVSLNNEMASLNREVHRQNAELARLNELKSRFLGMAAHDLRRPAGVILNYSEFLAEEAGPVLNAEQRDFLGAIRRSAEKMARLIDGFLDLAVIESGRLRLERARVEPADFVGRALEPLRVLARKRGVGVEIVIEGSLRPLDADAAKLEQVLENLVSNAVEYSPEGQTVTIRLGEGEGIFRLAVEDRGPGIPLELRDRLFQPYAAGAPGKPSGGRSTGLGLAISRMIVEAHGGRIAAESRPGGGTRFLLVIPSAGGSGREEAGS